jgi:Spy/CpxP family protein refolding chaperone
MKTFKSLALVAGMAFVTAYVSAQAPTTAPSTPAAPAQVQGIHNAPATDQMAQRMTTQVKQNVTDLTADQESQVLAAEKDFTTGLQAARASSNGDRDAMHTQMESLKATRDAKIKTILTADQYAQYQKAEAAHQGGGHKGGN